jgi:hypothetical protein
MTYTYKLASRLARLRACAFALSAAFSVACTSGDGDALSPNTSNGEYSIVEALRGRNKDHIKQRMVSFRVIPDTANLEPMDTTTFSALAKLSDGSSTSVKVNWSARATLTKITLTPASISLTSGATQQFTVAGTWSDGGAGAVIASYSATGGTISSTGLYSAGSAAGSYRVIATDETGSLADTALVTIQPPSATLTKITLTPASVSLTSGATRQFTVAATWSDGSAKAVSASYSATGGTIGSTGLYSAGSATGSYRVIATADSLADTALVTIESPPAPPPSSGCSTDKSNLTFAGSFEAPEPWSTWRIGEATLYPSETWALNAVANPARECDQSARIELRKTDGVIAGNHRHEIKLQNTGAIGGNGGVPVPTGVTPIGHLGSEVWWGWSVYIPSDWTFETGYAPETIMQVAAAGRSPAFEIQVDGADFKTYTRSGYGTQGASTIKTTRTSTTPISRGAWTDFVVHAKWSAGSDGVLEVWKNGAQIVDWTGPTAYSDWTSAPYAKWGVYKWSWGGCCSSNVSTRVLYLDAVRVTDGAHGNYAVVAPR